MRRIDWSSLDRAGRREALARPASISDPALIARVAAILADVRERGDTALADYTKRFDTEAEVALRVSPEEMEAAWTALPAAD